ncbi:LRR receptor-like serine/threonine-protein kinase EFR [Olea europaea var. sylvestris]|uniref:LRR receptor-like serine/threonine-protein kinase EFR n=1 Tax=Olea europaea var. sylvestris TaxID=158386 RepID=UPI000C1D640E|nr:LRR receptor-like serine/threonine-protein kinase EFR [Olea europaea var. sylvestris]
MDLNLADMGLGGTIAKQIDELSFLGSLIISNNNFHGFIPNEIGKLSQFQEIEMQYNEPTGSLPMDICFNLTKLETLRISVNQMCGNIPPSLGACMNLKLLSLSSNNVAGSIPLEIGKLSKAFYTVFHKRYSKCMPSSKHLLEIHHATVTPWEIGNLSAIEYLDLGSNNLSGMGNNPFHGILPKSLGNLSTSVEHFEADHCGIKGIILNEIGNLSNLIKLDIGSNELTEIIPNTLDLSKNKLNGVIPSSMEKLEYLEYFNVSFNELIGEIPNEGPFKNFMPDIFVGNRELCGASQFKVKTCEDNTTRISNKTRVLKYILPSILIIIILAITVIYLMRCYNRKTLLPALTTSPITIKRISYYEILDATKKFGEENLIGKGNVGSVYKGAFSNGMIVAIKVFNLDLVEANNSFDSECQILCNIRHRNLVKVISSCSNLDLKALVLEYVPNGNLTKWLSSSNYSLNLAQRLEILIDVASTQEYLHYGHPSPIVHCDLKPSNILLDKDMAVHVASFGIAKFFTKDQRISITKTLGTTRYMAPEYGSTGLVSTMADVYSFGIMLMKTFTKKKPTDDMFVEEFKMRKWVLESFPNAIAQIVGVDLVNAGEDNIRAKESYFTLIMELALECMTDLPKERLRAKDVVTRLKKIKTQFC